VEDESDDGDYGDEVEQIASLQQRIDDLLNEKTGLNVLNAELQKKAVALIAKEKAMQGQTAAARTAAEVVNTAANENADILAEQNLAELRLRIKNCGPSRASPRVTFSWWIMSHGARKWSS
jgi:hypothetical protein